MPESEKRPITVDDLWKLRRVGTPAVSPDGAFLVVGVTAYDVESNESTVRLYRVDGPGTEPRPLTAEDKNSSQPVLSPDGKRLAFLRKDADKNDQLAVLPMDGGEAEVLTGFPMGVTGPRWFPDGKRIAFLGTVYKDAPTVEKARERKKERDESKVKAYVTESCISRYWDEWITDGKTVHVFVIDLDSKEIRDLTPEFTGWFNPDGAEGDFDIAPDGGEIAFSADSSPEPHRKLNWDVFIVNTGGGKVANITEDNPADDTRPRYSPDGRFIVYGKQKIPGFYADRVRLARYDRKTGEGVVLTEDWDRSASEWSFTPDGEALVFRAEDRAAHAIYRIGLEGGAPEQLRRGGTYQAPLPLNDGSVVAAWDDYSHPGEIYRISPRGGEVERWTAFNAVRAEAIEWGETREGSVRGADGKPCQYYEILPPGFTPDRKWPLLLAIHGGPHGIWSDNFHFRWNMQVFAAWGFVVVAPNPHGSTSFGQDYADAIQGGWGDKPYVDLMAVTDAMAASGYIDENRMAAAGGSYGGYMVAWIAGRTDRFACLVNHAGVSNLLSEYASDIFDGWGRAMGGEPWDGIEAVDAMNPMRQAKGFASPMLVLHGERDYRVPATQGLEIYNVYKARGLAARLVCFPDENHWILKPQNSRLWHDEVLQWLRRWTAPDGGGGA